MSSLLERFYILFESNADDVNRGAREAEGATDDLEESLDDTNTAAQRTGKGFLQTMKDAKGAIASIIALGGATAVVLQGASYANDLRLSSMAIGENIGEIEAWGRATREFGGDSATLQGTLRSLNTSIRETAFTGEGSLSPALRRLGLNLRTLTGEIKTPLQLLPEIAKAFEGLSADESLFLGGQLGLDEGTILLLQKGRAGVEQLLGKQREFGVLTKEDAELSRLFNLQLSETGNTLVALRQRLTSEALPGLTWFLRKLEEIAAFISTNRPLVEGFFIGVAGIVTAFYLPAMLRAAAATLAATWPLILLIGLAAAVAAAFALVYDEIVNFSRGNNSLLGEAAKRWPLFAAGVDATAVAVKGLAAVFGFLGRMISDPVGAITELFETWSTGILGFVESIPLVGAALAKMMGFFNDTFGGVANLVRFVAGLISDLVAQLNPLSRVVTAFGLTADLVNAPFQDDDGGPGMMERARAALSLATSTPMSAQTANSVVNSQTRQTRTYTVPIESVVIQTAATDAQGISAAVSTSLVEQMRQALYNFDDGVDA